MTTEEICLRSMSNDELRALKNKLTLELNWIDSEVVRREGEKIFAVVDQYSPIGEVSFEFDASAVRAEAVSFCIHCGRDSRNRLHTSQCSLRRGRVCDCEFLSPAPASEPAVPPVLCEICGDPATCGERCDACCAGCIDNNHTKDGVGGEA